MSPRLVIKNDVEVPVESLGTRIFREIVLGTLDRNVSRLISSINLTRLILLVSCTTSTMDIESALNSMQNAGRRCGLTLARHIKRADFKRGNKKNVLITA